MDDADQLADARLADEVHDAVEQRVPVPSGAALDEADAAPEMVDDGLV